MEKKKEKRKEYVERIGPELKELIEHQKRKIIEATYGVSDASSWVAGEILAKKLKGEV
jgi:hypothetical protein